MIPSRSARSKFQRQDVKFLLPPYHKEQHRVTRISQLLSKHKLLHSQPVQLLTETESYLQEFNRSKILEARRLEILIKISGTVLNVLEQTHELYRKQHSVPENQNRKQLLRLCANVCQEFSIAYLRVCQHDYALSKIRLQRVKDRVAHCSHRALEFIYLQQRFKALRYQGLEKDCWHNINQLLFSAYYSDVHEVSHVPLLCSRLQGQSDFSPVTVAQLGVMIHLFAAVNVFTLPVPAMYEAANYIHRCRMDFTLREQQHSLAQNGVLQIALALDHCAEKYVPLDLKPILQLCFNQLHLTLRGECERLIAIFEQPLKDQHKDSFFNITSAEDIERLLAVTAALNNLSKDKRVEQREYVGRFNPLRLYLGFKPAFDFLADPEGNDADSQQPLNLQETARFKPKTLEKEQTVKKLTKWAVNNRSDGGALLETYDVDFERNIFVGQLLIYNEFSNAVEDSKLAYVTRLHRSYIQGNLQLALVNICDSFKPVAVQSPFLEQNAMALPGILCLDYADYPALLLHTSHRLQPNTPVALRVDKRKIQHVVEDILLIKREFVLYQLSEPVTHGLGADGARFR